MEHAAILCAALLLDAAFGEPRWLWSRLPHPAVVMGRAIGWCDRRFNHGPARLTRGASVLAALCAATFATGLVIAALGPWAEALAAAILLAQKSLVTHVRDVGDALRLSLGDGRRAVARIVGRDTAAMDPPAVARAAIESAAENLSDGVTAPAFWFLVGGLPAMAVYKMVNTADSMIGYRTDAYERFGKPAARLDDLLNWIPARLTALILAVLGHQHRAWRDITAEARRHRSPNAGWPEAAMARALDTALSGPRAYHGVMQDFPWVHPRGRRDAGPAEVDAAARLLWQAWAVMLASAAVLTVIG
ncbi:adenosylcobinamide-phosphate synthase CbiB [Pseudooceanicola sp. LIPI14-2-Ac024]|uniref:adenosylcobinamide-phosphate synthase CbiB n=1 Tax=Pseudooceanicola sp. LIPI14-2-Ac024 TaxID=3344875 RepID=UPI0035CF3F95